uniref:Bm9284 n=1 Tax=Brugia malayi TaxID=6279 RepID=A0A0H5S532_BRUMA|nr:Bm9284 [Brugia malayi]
MPSSASAIQQPYLRMTLRHALQRIQAAQQRYLDRNQFVIQLPMQANQQSTELIQQANAQQQLPQMPSQQLQSMFHVLTPSSTSNSTNAQMFRQFPQSQANSNLTPQQSQQQQQQQQTHMQSASQPFLQQSNSQNNHLITQSSQQINQSLLQSQQISQQQNSTAIQQLLLRLSQQIPTLPSQQSLQQTQPMLVQVLQQSSATSEPFRPEQEQQRQQQQQQQRLTFALFWTVKLPHLGMKSTDNFHTSLPKFWMIIVLYVSLWQIIAVRFVPLDIGDDESISDLLLLIDNTIQHGEDLEGQYKNWREKLLMPYSSHFIPLLLRNVKGHPQYQLIWSSSVTTYLVILSNNLFGHPQYQLIWSSSVPTYLVILSTNLFGHPQ